jgi:CheY-like chemotaxis protein
MDPHSSTDGQPEAFRAPYRFLVVDDNRDAAYTMWRLLQLLGGEVRTAHDGLEALAWAEQFLPHAIVLDIALPKLNGYEVAREIRARSWGGGMILVAVSGWCRDQDRQRALDAGFHAHLAKPVALKDLRDLLQGLLDGQPRASTQAQAAS